MARKREYQHEMVKVTDLKPHPENYREHPADQIEHLKESIKEHGFYRNVVVAKEGTILAGHGVVLACQELGIDEIPVVRLPVKPNDLRALKVLIGDNEIGRLSSMDDRQLTNLLKKIRDVDEDALTGTGFDKQKLAALLMVTRTQDEIKNFDAAAEWVGMPEFSPGSRQYELNVVFRTADDRKAFVKQAGIDESFLRTFSNDFKWATRWPPKEDDDLSALFFGEDDGEEDDEAAAS